MTTNGAASSSYASEHPLTRHPIGWFAVALSDELGPGAVLPVSAMGRELVAFRTASGAASVLDAYCAHIGTHLGHGGAVDGECLRCPFHRWGYGVDGACVDIPYVRKVPPRARVRAYPVHERNGVVLAWFHPDGAAPTFEIPAFEQEGWSPPAWAIHTLVVHVQELAENGVDIAHFPPVHRSSRGSLEMIDAKGLPFRFVLRTAYEGDGIGVPGREVRVSTEWAYYGPGMFQGLSTADDFGTRVRHLFHFTPIPGDRVLIRTGISAKLDTVPAGLVDMVLRKNVEITLRNLDEDAPMWAAKRYLTRAAFCETDGPFALLRRWGRRFYGLDETPAEDTADAQRAASWELSPEAVAALRRPLRIAPAAATREAPTPAAAPSPAPAPAPAPPAASAEAVRRAFFEQMPARFVAAAVPRPFVVQYDIGGTSGGAYFIDVDANRCTPGEGRHASPALSVAIDAADWVALNAGALDGAQAFMTGKLKVEGDFELAVKLGEVFPLPPAAPA